MQHRFSPGLTTFYIHNLYILWLIVEAAYQLFNDANEQTLKHWNFLTVTYHHMSIDTHYLIFLKTTDGLDSSVGMNVGLPIQGLRVGPPPGHITCVLISTANRPTPDSKVEQSSNTGACMNIRYRLCLARLCAQRKVSVGSPTWYDLICAYWPPWYDQINVENVVKS